MNPYMQPNDEFHFLKPASKTKSWSWADTLKPVLIGLVVVGSLMADNLQARIRSMDLAGTSLEANYLGAEKKELEQLLSANRVSQKDLESFLSSGQYGVAALNVVQDKISGTNTSTWTINAPSILESRKAQYMANALKFKQACQDKLFFKIDLPVFQIGQETRSFYVAHHELYKYSVGLGY